MFEVRQTLIFEEWLGKLSDKRAVRKILQRIVRLEEGLFGDVRPIGEGLSELRIDYGPGDRLYFAQRGRTLILLLCGGSKKTQNSDIKRAKQLASLNGDLKMLETKPFDAAKYLDTPESQAELLADALASGHAGYIANALGVIARARGMTEIAKEAGITREALYKSLSDDGDPKLSTLLGVIRALGMTLSVHPADSDSREAMAGD